MGNSIFLGVTTSPAREFIAKAILNSKAERILMPCVGRFAAVEAMAGSGIPAKQITASDICLFSSIIGYLAEPRRSISELGIELPLSLPTMPKTDAGDDYDLAAQTMLALGLGQLPQKHAKGLSERAYILNNWTRYHRDMVNKLKTLVGSIRGVRYEIKDLWEVVKGADKNTALYVNVPVYKNGYDRMWKDSNVSWKAPSISQFDYEQFGVLLKSLKDSGAKAVVYCQTSVKDIPKGWHVVYAETLVKGRTDFLISSFDPKKRVAIQAITARKPKRFPVYADEQITDESKVSMVACDRETCLYYRDLFIHKLGQTQARSYFLFLIDGRVVTAFGLDTSKLTLGHSQYVNEVFGISKTSKQYFYMGKLFMLLLTSGNTKRFLESTFNFGIREPKGIRTSSITTHHEGKTDRSVMKLESREQLPDGRFRIVYCADFRDDSWSLTLQRWLKHYGKKTRFEKPEKKSA